MKGHVWIATFLLLASCQQEAVTNDPRAAAERPMVSGGASEEPPLPLSPRELTVPAELTGGHADVHSGWIAWQSNATRGGRNVNSIWVSRIRSARPRSIHDLPKGYLGASVTVSFPYVAWVQYQETGNTTGTWDIYLHNLKTRSSRVAASWRDADTGKRQPIPLPYLDPAEPTLVWHQLEQGPRARKMCVKSYNVVSNSVGGSCLQSNKEFPHFARSRNGHLSYIINVGEGGQQGPTSIPVAPQHTGFQNLFAPQGELADWDQHTRAVEADGRGVAWIAESTEYAKGASVYYWEPEAGVRELKVRTRRFPASQLQLTDEAVVWEEPIAVNDILGVRRSAFGCEEAVVAFAKAAFGEKRYKERYANTFQLQGASMDEVLVSVFRSTEKPPYALPTTFAVFDLSSLPEGCPE